jgi:hypothetical protein
LAQLRRDGGGHFFVMAGIAVRRTASLPLAYARPSTAQIRYAASRRMDHIMAPSVRDQPPLFSAFSDWS